MKQLRTQHNLLFRILRDHCLFLTRRQIERVLTLPTSSANRELLWLLAGRYLERRYRADSFIHFQTPLYYLGVRGWRMAGMGTEDYKAYQSDIEQRSGRELDHLLSVYDVLLKFLLESEVKRIIGGEDRFWHEVFEFGNIPDAWVQSNGIEAFIEVDLGTEREMVVAKKIENYLRLKDSGGYEIMFPECGFKVLFITTTEERIESLERITPSDDIWFCTMDEFMREKLDHQHWFASKGFYALPIAAKKEVPQLR